MGRPTKYEPAFCEVARKLCEKFGATNEQLAEYFEVNVDTIYEWQNTHSEFSEAIKEGKKPVDDQVEEAFLKRALGYSHPAVKIFNNDGKPMIVPYTEHYPPDTAAAFIWLKNRRSDKWRQQPEPQIPETEQGDLVLERGPSRKSQQQIKDEKKNGTK